MKNNSYRPATAHHSLGERFFDPVDAADFPMQVLRYRNDRAARSVGLESLGEEDWLAHFAGFRPLPDTLQKPLALRYHGHQFRNYNADIGDGRGFLFAQLMDADDRLLDLGTKGSGQTPYSRFGDGRLTLKGGVREVLATEMLEALGVYTSKSFSLIETGEALERGDEPSPTRSAVLTRLSHSHIRFGTFQYLAYHQYHDDMMRLVDHCVDHYFPHLADHEDEARVLAFFEAVIERTASLAASWMAAGFVHGVLNTDNMNITGESFDYGPWRFLPAVQPGFTAAYFDQQGLYAYGRQPEAAGWNLAQLGGALMPIASEAALNEALQTFPDYYERAMRAHFARRLGVAELSAEITGLVLRWMNDTQIKFERFFFDWFCGPASQERAAESPHAALYDDERFAPLGEALLGAEPVAPERVAHPYFSGEPCTMLIEEMEAVWAPIDEADDWSAFETKLAEIGQMRAAYDFTPVPFLG